MVQSNSKNCPARFTPEMRRPDYQTLWELLHAHCVFSNTRLLGGTAVFLPTLVERLLFDISILLATATSSACGIFFRNWEVHMHHSVDTPGPTRANR